MLLASCGLSGRRWIYLSQILGILGNLVFELYIEG